MYALRSIQKDADGSIVREANTNLGNSYEEIHLYRSHPGGPSVENTIFTDIVERFGYSVKELIEEDVYGLVLGSKEPHSVPILLEESNDYYIVTSEGKTFKKL